MYLALHTNTLLLNTERPTWKKHTVSYSSLLAVVLIVRHQAFKTVAMNICLQDLLLITLPALTQGKLFVLYPNTENKVHIHMHHLYMCA